MPKTFSTTVYSFDELGDSAKAKARDWFREGIGQDTDWAEAVIEDAEHMAKIIGIEVKQYPVKTLGGKTIYVPAIYWQLHSQGAGASVEGRYLYRPGAAKEIRQEAPPDPAKAGGDSNARLNAVATDLQELQRRHSYKLSASLTSPGNNPYVSVNGQCDHCELSAEDHRELADILRNFCRWIYDNLNSEWDYQTSDEVVDENIRANEYQFTASGSRRVTVE